MASKRLYLQITQHYGHFILPTKDRISNVHFNEAVDLPPTMIPLIELELLVS